jgi:hypothetical protein
MSSTASVVYITGTSYSSRARGFTHSFKRDSVANLFSFLYSVLFCYICLCSKTCAQCCLCLWLVHWPLRVYSFICTILSLGSWEWHSSSTKHSFTSRTEVIFEFIISDTTIRRHSFRWYVALHRRTRSFVYSEGYFGMPHERALNILISHFLYTYIFSSTTQFIRFIKVIIKCLGCETVLQNTIIIY